MEVRVLGSLCLIDQNQVDWKVLCMNEKEAQSKNVFFNFNSNEDL